MMFLFPNQWCRNPFLSHPKGVRSPDIRLDSPSAQNLVRRKTDELYTKEDSKNT